MDNSVMDNASEISQDNAVNSTQSNERLFNQSELNEIVGRAKHDAVESYKRNNSQSSNQQNQIPYQQSNVRNSLSEDDVRRMTSEEMARQRDEWARESQERANVEMAERIAANYHQKISSGREKYADFDKVVNEVNMQYYPRVVHLLAEYVDNSHDVLYDLANKRTKLHEIESLYERNPNDAIHEIRRLSESIKRNEEANQVKTPNSPLSQAKSSNIGMDSGSTLSWNDLKRKYRA